MGNDRVVLRSSSRSAPRSAVLRSDLIQPGRSDADVARVLGVSTEAVALTREAELFDLHVDSFIWKRLFGYAIERRHRRGLLGRHVYAQVDLPRARLAGLDGATWVITTNPFRPARSRRETFFANYERLETFLASQPEVALVRDVDGYRAARRAGKHAAFIGIQGGNALDLEPDDLERFASSPLLRVTLVHLTSSAVGATSFPPGRLLGTRAGLGPAGPDMVRACNHARIAVDLAHIEERAFFEAAAVNDPARPIWITHTGAAAVHSLWRNASDSMLKVVAENGGVVGVIFEQAFLGPGASAARIVDHLDHMIEVVGEDFVAIGSDFDGAITPPPDLPSVLAFPRLVQEMMTRGYASGRIEKVLGLNVLRSLELLRPSSSA